MSNLKLLACCVLPVVLESAATSSYSAMPSSLEDVLAFAHLHQRNCGVDGLTIQSDVTALFQVCVCGSELTVAVTQTEYAAFCALARTDPTLLAAMQRGHLPQSALRQQDDHPTRR
jgi:hypothetical protein